MIAQKKFTSHSERPLVLGHRGVMALHQENSFSGFRRAMELGIDGVEMDVKLTRDRRVVVFHDDSTERLTGVRGQISDMTWDQVSQLRLQRRIPIGQGRFTDYEREERIPLLEEVLSEFGGRLLMNIEMSVTEVNWNYRHLGTRVATLLKKAGVTASVIVTSFDPFMLRFLKKESPELASGLSYHAGMVDVVATWLTETHILKSMLNLDRAERYARNFIHWVLDTNFVGRLTNSTVLCSEDAMINEEVIRKFRQRGMLVGAYTMFPRDLNQAQPSIEDQLSVLRRLIELDVDWIETDEPELTLQLLTLAGSRRAR
jgi:glycerophosphoryl diester phosphodiesterase